MSRKKDEGRSASCLLRGDRSCGRCVWSRRGKPPVIGVAAPPILQLQRSSFRSAAEPIPRAGVYVRARSWFLVDAGLHPGLTALQRLGVRLAARPQRHPTALTSIWSDAGHRRAKGGESPLSRFRATRRRSQSGPRGRTGAKGARRFTGSVPRRVQAGNRKDAPKTPKPAWGSGFSTERRRSRTYRAVGYTTAPVLKTISRSCHLQGIPCSSGACAPVCAPVESSGIPTVRVCGPADGLVAYRRRRDRQARREASRGPTPTGARKRDACGTRLPP